MKEAHADFIVRTLHPSYSNEFIVATAVEAASHLEAAQRRFDLQTPSSQEDTTALLVQKRVDGCNLGSPQIFFVERRLEVVA